MVERQLYKIIHSSNAENPETFRACAAYLKEYAEKFLQDEAKSFDENPENFIDFIELLDQISNERYTLPITEANDVLDEARTIVIKKQAAILETYHHDAKNPAALVAMLAATEVGRTYFETNLLPLTIPMTETLSRLENNRSVCLPAPCGHGAVLLRFTKTEQGIVVDIFDRGMGNSTAPAPEDYMKIWRSTQTTWLIPTDKTEDLVKIFLPVWNEDSKKTVYDRLVTLGTPVILSGPQDLINKTWAEQSELTWDFRLFSSLINASVTENKIKNHFQLKYKFNAIMDQAKFVESPDDMKAFMSDIKKIMAQIKRKEVCSDTNCRHCHEMNQALRTLKNNTVNPRLKSIFKDIIQEEKYFDTVFKPIIFDLPLESGNSIFSAPESFFIENNSLEWINENRTDKKIKWRTLLTELRRMCIEAGNNDPMMCRNKIEAFVREIKKQNIEIDVSDITRYTLLSNELNFLLQKVNIVFSEKTNVSESNSIFDGQGVREYPLPDTLLLNAFLKELAQSACRQVIASESHGQLAEIIWPEDSLIDIAAQKTVYPEQIPLENHGAESFPAENEKIKALWRTMEQELLNDEDFIELHKDYIRRFNATKNPSDFLSEYLGHLDKKTPSDLSCESNAKIFAERVIKDYLIFPYIIGLMSQNPKLGVDVDPYKEPIEQISSFFKDFPRNTNDDLYSKSRESKVL